MTKHSIGKSLETTAKTLIYNVDPKTISSQKPDVYQRRFVNFFSQKLLSEDYYK